MKIIPLLVFCLLFPWTGNAQLSGGGASGLGLKANVTGSNITDPAAFRGNLGIDTSYPAKSYGVAATNTAVANRTALQALIDTLSAANGGTIILDQPLEMTSGILLKKNVKLRGNNDCSWKGPGPVGGGIATSGATPSGACLIIRDAAASAITLYSNTSVEGICIYYPDQAFTATNPASVVAYPVAITNSNPSQSMAVRRCTFVGEYAAMAFVNGATGDIEVDQCYGYPLGGSFLHIATCYDIPRITRCHVNPGSGTNFRQAVDGALLPFTYELMDNVCATGNPTYRIVSTDEFSISNCFVFGSRRGLQVEGSYGSVSQCNFDMVTVGVYYVPGETKNYLSLTSCNFLLGGGEVTDRNAFYIDGGATGGSLVATNCFARVGTNAVISSSAVAGANSFIKIVGTPGVGFQATLIAPTIRPSGTGASISNFKDTSDALQGVKIIGGDFSGLYTATRKFPADLTIGDAQLNNIEILDGAVKTRSVTLNKTINVKVAGLIYKIPANRDTYLVEDQFSDSNGTALTAHTPNSGPLWTKTGAGTATIQSNKAQITGDVTLTSEMDSPDGVLELEFTGTGTSVVGLKFRDGWRFQINSLGMWYFIQPGGSIESSAAISLTAGVSHTIKVVLEGISIKMYIDGVPILFRDKFENWKSTTHGFLNGDTVTDFDYFKFTDAL